MREDIHDADASPETLRRVAREDDAICTRSRVPEDIFELVVPGEYLEVVVTKR